MAGIIVWDEPKRIKNIEKHGLDFSALGREFFISALILEAKKDRLQAVGYFRREIISVIFVQYGEEYLSVISMRPANKKEKRLLNEQES